MDLSILLFSILLVTVSRVNAYPESEKWNSLLPETLLSQGGAGMGFLEDAIIPFYIKNLVKKIENNEIYSQDIFKNVSTECAGHTSEWFNQIIRFRESNFTAPIDLWSLQMLDAFAKLPEGILSGHINPAGDFDECVQIKAKNVQFSPPTETAYPNLSKNFAGKYCTIYLIPGVSPSNDEATQLSELSKLVETRLGQSVSPLELLRLMGVLKGILMIPTIGACLPSSCSDQEFGIIISNVLTAVGLGNIITNRVFYCAIDEKPDFDAGDISMIVILGVLVGLALFAGVVDMWIHRSDENTRQQKGFLLQCFLAFSFYTNTKKWMNTKASGDDLGCVHGIRFLGTCWVLLGHTYYMTTFVPLWNMVDVKNIHHEWSILTVLNATIAVDTFFVLSGMLVAFNMFKLLDKTKGRLNLPLIYLHRYLRITPTYAILVGIMATLVPYFGRGPYWFWMDAWSRLCEDNWWTNLLYVNNFVKTDLPCQGEAWYLANDMQFYIVSPLFIYPLWKWPKLGWIFMVLSTIASILCPALLVYFNETIPTTIGTRELVIAFYYREIYLKPWARIQTFLVGICLGYFLYKLRRKQFRIPKLLVLAGWTISTATSLTVIYGIFPWFNPHNEIPRIEGMVYAGLHRYAWGVSLCWVIFACVKGYGGLVNAFLSWKPFIPLGRLCFCVYLVSLHLQMTLHLNMKQTIAYDPYTWTNFYFAHVVMSFFAGFLCTIVLESPFIILEKLLFEGRTAKQPQQDEIKKAANDPENPAPKRNGIFYENPDTNMKIK